MANGNAAVAAVPQGAAAAPINLTGALPDFTSLVERYGPAVVNVAVIEKRVSTITITSTLSAVATDERNSHHLLPRLHDYLAPQFAHLLVTKCGGTDVVYSNGVQCR